MTQDSRQTFEGVKILSAANARKKLIIRDENSHAVEADHRKAEIANDWFKEQISKGKHEELDPFEGKSRPLNVALTPREAKMRLEASIMDVQMVLI